MSLGCGGSESLGSPGDRCSSGVAPSAGVAVDDHRSEADAVVV